MDEKSVSEKVKKLKKISKKMIPKLIFWREMVNLLTIYIKVTPYFFKDRLINIDNREVFGEMISDIWDDVLPNDIHNEGGVTLRKRKKT